MLSLGQLLYNHERLYQSYADDISSEESLFASTFNSPEFMNYRAFKLEEHAGSLGIPMYTNLSCISNAKAVTT